MLIYFSEISCNNPLQIETLYNKTLYGATIRVPCNIKVDLLSVLDFDDNGFSKIYIKVDSCSIWTTKDSFYIKVKRTGENIEFTEYVYDSSTPTVHPQVYGNLGLISSDSCDLRFTNVDILKIGDFLYPADQHCPFSTFVFFNEIRNGQPLPLADRVSIRVYEVPNKPPPEVLIKHHREIFDVNDTDDNFYSGDNIFCYFDIPEHTPAGAGVFPKSYNSPNISYTWKIEDMKQSETKLNFKLSKMSGIYQCTAHFTSYSTEYSWKVTSSKIHISMIYGPENGIITSKQYVKEGKLGSVLCSFECNPPADFSTSTPNFQIVNSSAIKWVVEFIYNAKTIEILCNAVNVKTHERSSLSTIIEFQYISLAFMEKFSVNEGDKLTMKCSAVEANPEVLSMKLYQNSSLLKEESGNSISYQKLNILREEKSMLRCVAENGVIEKQKTSDLDVFYGPDSGSITSQLTIKEGESAVVTCSFQSYPPASFISSSANYHVISGNSIKWQFNDLKSNDNNKIVNCTAYNGKTKLIKSISTMIIVQYMYLEFNSSFESIENESIEVICSAKMSNPPVNSLQLLLGKNIVHQVNADTLKTTLVSTSDDNYKKLFCVSDNGVEKQTKEANLTVYYGPYLITEKVLIVNEGSITTGTIAIHSFPPANLNCSSTAFTISENLFGWNIQFVSKDMDQTIYTCYVYNYRKDVSKSSTIKLIVHYTPEIKFILSETYVIEGDQMNFICSVIRSNPDTAKLTISTTTTHKSLLNSDVLSYETNASRYMNGEVNCKAENSMFGTIMKRYLVVYYVDFDVKTTRSSTDNSIFTYFLSDIISLPSNYTIALFKNETHQWNYTNIENITFSLPLSNVYYEYVLVASNEFTSKKVMLDFTELKNDSRFSYRTKIFEGFTWNHIHAISYSICGIFITLLISICIFLYIKLKRITVEVLSKKSRFLSEKKHIAEENAYEMPHFELERKNSSSFVNENNGGYINSSENIYN